MNTEIMNQFDVLNDDMLVIVEGGKNNWQANALGVATAAFSGAAIGSSFCGPACGYIGAKFTVSLWFGVTAATGGF